MTIRQKLNTEKAAGIVCTMPFIVGFLAFMIIPMCISLYYSFCDYNILQPPTFTGWANFKRMFSDATFYQSLVVTFKFAIISVPLRLIFALIVALLLFKSTKMTGVYRALYYLPSIIGGSVAVAILWKRLFAVDGLVNKLLMVFGMKEPVAWLGDTRTAIWTLIILAVWQFGSSMLIFLSALKQIPVSLYEGDDREVNATVATGRLAAPYIGKMIKLVQKKFPNVQAEVYAVKNNFFGEKITVSGGSVDSVSIPKSVTSIRKDAFTACSDLKNVYMTGYSSLDDLTVEDVRQALKTEVVVVDEPGADLVNCLIEVPDHKKIRRRQIYEQTGSSDSGQT